MRSAAVPENGRQPSDVTLTGDVSRLQPDERRQGFALVIALSLMAFILLLLVSLTAIVRVETESANIQMANLKARQNALLGLQVALGELQRTAGPDKRATGTAGLLDDSPDSESIDGVTHPHWTGVWDPDDPGNPAWLVSREDSSDPPDPTEAADSPVELVGAGPGTTAVEAPEVAIGDEGQGGFAWWVGDEGVKAKINTTNPYLDDAATAEEGALSLQVAQRAAMERIDDVGGDPIGDAFDPAAPETRERLRRTHGLPSLETALPAVWDEDLRRERFHDVTLVSAGLAADATGGGLRKDLSLAFEMDLTDFNADTIFAAGGDFPLGDYGDGRPMDGNPLDFGIRYVFEETDGTRVRGPSWHLMRNFYRLYKANDPDRALRDNDPGGVRDAGTDNPVVTARANYFGDVFHRTSRWSDHTSDVMTDPEAVRMTERALAPVFVSRQLVASLEAIEQPKENPDDPTEYKLRLHLDPVETLWNPYTTALEFSNLVSGFIWAALEAEITLNQPGEDPVAIREDFADFSNDISQGGSRFSSLATRLNATGKRDDSEADRTVRMAPGEILVFSNIEGESDIDPDSNQLRAFLGPGLGEGANNIQNAVNIFFDRLDPNNKLNRNDEIIVEEGTTVRFEIIGNQGNDLQSRVQMIDSSGNEYSSFSKFVFSDSVSRDTFTIDLPVGGGGLNPQPVTPRKEPVGSLRVALKAEDAGQAYPFLANGNPFAGGIHSATEGKGYGIGPDNLGPDNHELGLRKITSWSTDLVQIDTDDRGFWGPSRDASGVNQVPLLDLPTAPLLSLASLQHLSIPILPHQSAMAIGNAYASPYLPRDQVRHGLPTNRGTRTQIDYSYLLNEALFDRFFFSSLAPRPHASPAARDIEEVFDAAVENGGRLPNTRMRLDPAKGETFDALKARLLDDGKPTAEAYERIAENLLIDGAFNVNSTSVEAWKAVLAGTTGTDVEYSGGTENDADSPLTRYRVPPGPINQGGKEEEWSGFNTLSPAEIEALAKAVVREVKKRGPFLSLADFVNRRLTTDDTGLRGTLQAAIDETSINAGFSKGFRVENRSTPANFDFPDPEAMHGAAAAGAPGFLTQADLLVPLGSILASRSDTFVIRAYGVAKDPFGGGPTSRVWCEAVVQRLPEKVDPAKPIETEADGFGRRFKIVNFRWLAPDEV